MPHDVTTADLIKTVSDTTEHIRHVQGAMMAVINDLIERSKYHDASKLLSPELEGFASLSAKLSDIEYGMPEYSNALKEAEETIQHHYEMNDHHPQYFHGGVRDMNLVQMLEMLCDWYAAGLRMKPGTGSLYKSIDVNRKRFNMDDTQVRLLVYTAKYFGMDFGNISDYPELAAICVPHEP